MAEPKAAHTDLLEKQNADLAKQYAVSQAQYKVLEDFSRETAAKAPANHRIRCDPFTCVRARGELSGDPVANPGCAASRDAGMSRRVSACASQARLIPALGTRHSPRTGVGREQARSRVSHCSVSGSGCRAVLSDRAGGVRVGGELTPRNAVGLVSDRLALCRSPPPVDPWSDLIGAWHRPD
jgi:hypothetical protein